MTENETHRFIDHLDDLVKTYNTRQHRIIKMSPFDAENNPDASLKINLLSAKDDSKVKYQTPSLKIGSYVRIAKQKGKFSRGYKEQANQEIFKIYDISKTKKIPLYYLETYNGSEKIKGGFYKFELTPVNTNIFRIEKILRRRTFKGKRQILVKWKGFDDTYNEWIDEDNVERIF